MWKGFQKPKRLAAEPETLTDKYGKFSAQPFERGWGTTVGNSLRRALLSSIEGAAITAVKIEGVLHEFSPIPGVVEDATDIILNLKQVPLKLNTDQPKTITLIVDTPGPTLRHGCRRDRTFLPIRVIDHGKAPVCFNAHEARARDCHTPCLTDAQGKNPR